MKNLRKALLGAAVAVSLFNVNIFAAASSSGEGASSSGWEIPEDSLFAQLTQGYEQRTGMPCSDDHSAPGASSSSSSSSAEPSSSSSITEEHRSKRLREGTKRRAALFYGAHESGSDSEEEGNDDDNQAKRLRTVDGKVLVEQVRESVVGLAHGAVSLAQNVSSSAQTVLSYMPGCSASDQDKQDFYKKIEALNKLLALIEAENYEALWDVLSATVYKSFFERDLYAPFIMKEARTSPVMYQNAVNGYILSMATEIIDLCAQDLRRQIMNFGIIKSFTEKDFVEYVLAKIEALDSQSSKQREKARIKIRTFEQKYSFSTSELFQNVSGWHMTNMTNELGYAAWNEHAFTCQCYWNWYKD
ncbi:hypothetical protein K2W90_06440 [Candidatus Babeliales bacterium]|nr:hypothetical protein [Candidatus Babeliales bacterium]